MSKARLVIAAVTIEKRQVSEVAKSYGVARSWTCTLLDRYQARSWGGHGRRGQERCPASAWPSMQWA
jgi:hypothetical protein